MALNSLAEMVPVSGMRGLDSSQLLVLVGSADGAIAFQGIDSIEPIDVNGVTQPWIRGRLIEAPKDPHETVVDAVFVVLDQSRQSCCNRQKNFLSKLV